MKPIEILIVDDDDIDSKAIVRAMDKLEITNTTHRAKDGLEALTILRDDSSTSIKRPYIILLDINMPRMTGLELLKIIRKDKKLKDSIIFVLTTSNSEQDKIAAYSYNIAGYMIKQDIRTSFIESLAFLNHYWEIVELPPSKL